MTNASLLQELLVAEASPLPTTETPDAVKNFLQRTGAEALATTAVRLVEELFPQPHVIQFEVSRDPEEKAEWLVVRVLAHASPQALTAAYRQYVTRWVRETPPDKRHLVCLTRTSV